MNKSAWSPEERQAFKDIANEAWASAEATGDRAARFRDLLLDARQAHRYFASEVLNTARDDGLVRILKSEHQQMVAVSYRGHLLSKPRIIGAKRSSEEGHLLNVQTLFDFMTWDELEAKVGEYLRQVGAYRADIHTIMRLLELREKVPTAGTPAQAADALGTTVEAWLAEDAA